MQNLPSKSPGYVSFMAKQTKKPEMTSISGFLAS